MGFLRCLKRACNWCGSRSVRWQASALRTFQVLPAVGAIHEQQASKGHAEFKALERAFKTPSDTARKQFCSNTDRTLVWHVRATVFCIQWKHVKVGCKEKRSMLVWGLLLSSNDYKSRLLRFFLILLKSKDRNSCWVLKKKRGILCETKFFTFKKYLSNSSSGTR